MVKFRVCTFFLDHSMIHWQLGNMHYVENYCLIQYLYLFCIWCKFAGSILNVRVISRPGKGPSGLPGRGRRRGSARHADGKLSGNLKLVTVWQ